MKDKRILQMGLLLIVAAAMKWALVPGLENNNFWVKLAAVIVILAIGAAFVLRKAAEIIEETTEVLSERTKLAGGVLQSIGTAFPDMVLGVVAALVSLKLRSTDYAGAINYAIIAAATTFGSNIYNIAHATWCVYRQNLACNLKVRLPMFPFLGAGTVRPLAEHPVQPSAAEMDTAVDILISLTVLTAVVAISMVIFGKVSADLYQLVRPAGIIILIFSLIIMYYFRKTKRGESAVPEVATEEKYYKHKSNLVIWASLGVAGVAILLAAESMVHAVGVFCQITGVPFFVAGVLAGMIGCLGEMLVIHNYTIHPQGRIGDALVGVGMDNIVTTMGAAIVSIMGGIFLGGSSLILIFVVILAANTLLIWQISKMKNYLSNSSSNSLPTLLAS